ncbi:MAG: HupE/UreJ family protein [Candidatus Gracilibacteria bacterium]|nr:HupE/UreJ family protein [Candidatus Gracilibacteria bacterium]
MKKFVVAVFVLFGLLFIAESSVSLVSAHEIIPADVLELIQNNPDITADEIDAFVASQGSDTWAGQWQLFQDFVVLGVKHILEGLDHILFVLTLVLVYTRLGHVLKLVTSFTIAHSITLILAGSGFFELSSSVVEPLIALSIVYMAIFPVFFAKNELVKSERRQIFGVFFFGLFHGLGFAGLLADLNIPVDHFLLSLLSFNVGVEVGQVLILAAVIPMILLLKKTSYYQVVMKCSAVVMAAVALFWVVERTVGFGVFG